MNHIILRKLRPDLSPFPPSQCQKYGQSSTKSLGDGTRFLRMRANICLKVQLRQQITAKTKDFGVEFMRSHSLGTNTIATNINKIGKINLI